MNATTYTFIFAIVIQRLKLHALWLEAFLATTDEKKLNYLEALAKVWFYSYGNRTKTDAIETQFKNVFARTRRAPAIVAYARKELARQQELELDAAELEGINEPRVNVVTDKWTCAQLREECKARGLKVSGRKAELIARLS